MLYPANSESTEFQRNSCFLFGVCELQEEKALRNNKRFTTIDTRKDGIRFNNSALRQLNEQFQAFKETYNEVQSNLANEVIKVAGM